MFRFIFGVAVPGRIGCRTFTTNHHHSGGIIIWIYSQQDDMWVCVKSDMPPK